jgi:hypothetical protein
LIEDSGQSAFSFAAAVCWRVIVDRIAERIIDRVRLLVAETGGEVLLELLMLGNADAAALWGAVALIVADQPFDFEGFALHRAALPAAASVDEKMRSISDAGIMAAP